MRKSQIALGERWKYHFQASRFQNFKTPQAAHNSGTRVPPHLYYPYYGTEQSVDATIFVIDNYIYIVWFTTNHEGSTLIKETLLW